MSEPLVIIGNGMAAARLCEELSQRALGRYAIAVVGKEPRLAYNRVLLSSVLAGEVAASDLTVKPADWWRKHGVTLCYGTAATAIDAKARTVSLEDGSHLSYAKLVFATGSRAVRLPIAGVDLPGVLTFRDLADTESLVRAARRGSRAVVIGGGLLGIEAAYGLAKAGVAVTLVHLMDRLMERQLDARAGAMLKRAVEAKGIEVKLDAATARIVGTDRAEAVELKDGSLLPADTVVIAVGIAPNAEIARSAGLGVNRGIVVGDDLATSDPNVFAIGECAEHRGVCYGLVEPANEQARVLAERFAGRDTRYSGSVNATNLKVSGVHVFSAGDFLGAPGTESITLADAGLGIYRKLVIEGERLVGAALYGDTADARWYLELLRSGASIEAIRQDLIFGRAFVERKAAVETTATGESRPSAKPVLPFHADVGPAATGSAKPAFNLPPAPTNGLMGVAAE
jgi:nitrite reductase (NADH) large subunit